MPCVEEGTSVFTGTQQSLVRRLNDEMICQNLRLHGPQSRTDLARLGGVSVPAALKMIKRLMDAGLVVEAGSAAAGPRGPRAQLFDLSPEFGIITTLHLIGDTLTRADWDLTGVPRLRQSLPFDRDGDIAAQVLAAAALPQAARQVLVVGLPGAVNPSTGDISASTELERWVPGTAARIVAGTAAEVIFDNEVNLRADAEFAEGEALLEPDFLLVSLGQGLGASVVVGGRVLRGDQGAAGEIGYLITHAGSDHPTFQEAAGGWRLAAVLGDRHDPDYGWVSRLVERCGPEAPEWERLAEEIAPGIVSLLAAVNPPLVVLGGEISRLAGESLRRSIEASVERQLPWPAPRFRLSTRGDEAVLLGGHYRGWDALISSALQA